MNNEHKPDTPEKTSYEILMGKTLSADISSAPCSSRVSKGVGLSPIIGIPPFLSLRPWQLASHEGLLAARRPVKFLSNENQAATIN